MIRVELDKEMYNAVVRSLRDVEKSEESVLKTAVNNTAKKAQKLLAQQAGRIYAGEAPKGILKRSSLGKATVKSPSVTISFRSEQFDLTKFKVSKNGTTPTRTVYSSGKRKKFPIKATQLKSGKTKLLSGKYGLAFCVKLRNGKLIVVSHVPGRTKNGSGKIKALMGSSDKIMVQNDKVYGAVNDKISEMLREQCQRALDKALGG